jgi:hypothetical protein
MIEGLTAIRSAAQAGALNGQDLCEAVAAMAEGVAPANTPVLPLD